MRHIWILITLIVCFTCLSSCFDADMLDPDTDHIGVKPDVILPIGNFELTLGDLLVDHIGDDQSIVVENGVFVLKHFQEDIAEFKIKDLMEFPSDIGPEESVIAIDGPLSTYSGNMNDIPVEIDLVFPPIHFEYTVDPDKDGVILKTLDCGFLFDIAIESLPFDYNIRIEFEGNEDMLIDKDVIRGTTLPPFDFTNSNIVFNTTDLDKRNELIMTAIVTIIKGDYEVDFSVLSPEIPVSFSMKEFEFEKAEGDFGKMVVNFAPASFDLDMGDLDNLVGNFGFTDPEIKLILHNRNMGFKFKLDLNLVAVANDDSRESILNELSDPFIVDQLEKPIKASESAISQFIVYNKSNSNIVNFMDEFPFKKIEYGGSFTLNPDEEGIHYPDLSLGEFNFITSDASLSFDVEIKIPSKFKAIDGISYTYIVEDIDIDEDIKEKIISAGLIFKAKNDWPIGVSFKNMVFRDANNNPLGSLEGVILNAPVIDSDGLPIDGKTDPFARIMLTDEIIDILDKVKNIELLIQLEGATALDGRDDPTLIFTDSAKLNLVMGVEAKLDLSQTN